MRAGLEAGMVQSRLYCGGMEDRVTSSMPFVFPLLALSQRVFFFFISCSFTSDSCFENTFHF